jgi:hypothetical protein
MPYPAKKGTLKPGYISDVSVVYDVVHASHEFSQAYMQSHGLRNLVEGDPHRSGAEAEIRNRRGAGEWRGALVFRTENGNVELQGEADLGRGTMTIPEDAIFEVGSE